MTKSLALQAELGPVFDVTLDCEDGAPVGAEAAHAELVTAMLMSPANVHGRCGVRVIRSGIRRSPPMCDDRRRRRGASGLRHAAQGRRRRRRRPRRRGARRRRGRPVPLHALVETHGGLREVAAIAAHPRIESSRSA
jgi:citrate lyase subunit beta/citryl-CoA lyase